MAIRTDVVSVLIFNDMIAITHIAYLLASMNALAKPVGVTLLASALNLNFISLSLPNFGNPEILPA